MIWIRAFQAIRGPASGHTSLITFRLQEASMGNIMRISDSVTVKLARSEHHDDAMDARRDTAVLADAATAIDAILAQAHEHGAVDAVRVLGNLSSLLRALPR
jgi:hypothetical protein